jgi:cobalt/nickel transport system permease protein
MGARGFRKQTDIETLRTIGNFLGMLLVRSFERTQRVYDAMLARGYDGTLPGVVGFHARRSDWLKGAFWLAAGLAVLAADRLLGIEFSVSG